MIQEIMDYLETEHGTISVNAKELYQLQFKQVIKQSYNEGANNKQRELNDPMAEFIEDMLGYVELEHGSIDESIREQIINRLNQMSQDAYKSGAKMMENRIKNNGDFFNADTYYENNF